MTNDQFDVAFRAFCQRRPFRAFLIEFASGNHLLIPHPEAVRKEGSLHGMRRPDSGVEVFAAESVTRLRDVPAETK